MTVEARHHVRAALTSHADRLVPSGVDDLVNILGDELSNMTESQIKEVVGYRLGSERFAHYLKSGQSTPARTPAAGGQSSQTPAPGSHVFGGRVFTNLTPEQVQAVTEHEARQAEATQRLFEAARQAQTTNQLGHAVGLRGQWGVKG